MRTVSALYRRLLADFRHVKEIRIVVDGVTYEQRQIVSCHVSGGEFPDFVVGSCASREIELSLIPTGATPIGKMAQVSAFHRLALGSEASEWLPSGVFFIDTRVEDEKTGVLTAHCFDALMKTEEVWLDPSKDAGVWPMSQRAAVNDIAARIGAGVDPRTQINHAYVVEYPNDLTMREVLGSIAIAHIGNWIVTNEGKLLLIGASSVPPETNFLVDGEDGFAILFGSVRVLI